MSDEKPTRRDILRPLHLLGIALACGVFAAIVTLVSTGAFTARVNSAIARGSYEGLTPIALGLVVGGGAFIVTLLFLAMLILVVDPAEVTKTVDRPVLFDPEASDGSDTPGSGTPGSDTDEPGRGASS